jgi:3-methyladenine DNA glycosylase AlkD
MTLAETWATPTNLSSIEALQHRLTGLASAEKKRWWERYLRHVIPFRGVNLVDIRAQLQKWYPEQRIGELSPEDQLDLAAGLFAQEYAEDKLAGVLLMEIYLLESVKWRTLLSVIEDLFRREFVFDWNVCDWLCVRVIGPLIDRNGIACAKRVAGWAGAKIMWQARASVVSFVNLLSVEAHISLVLDACDSLIRKEERFAKTGVGWLLRELSKRNKELVEQFILERREHFTTEVLKNATKYLEG